MSFISVLVLVFLFSNFCSDNNITYMYQYWFCVLQGKITGICLVQKLLRRYLPVFLDFHIMRKVVRICNGSFLDRWVVGSKNNLAHYVYKKNTTTTWMNQEIYTVYYISSCLYASSFVSNYAVFTNSVSARQIVSLLQFSKEVKPNLP